MLVKVRSVFCRFFSFRVLERRGGGGLGLGQSCVSPKCNTAFVHRLKELLKVA